MNLRRLPILVVIVAALAHTLTADDAERVMTLEVQLNDVTLSKTAFPLFNAQHGDAVDEPQKTISFSFKPEHAMLWMVQKGVYVTPVKTRPNQEIECSIQIWPAETDFNGPTISVSFYSDENILLRAVHVAHPKKRKSFEIATGLTVSTRPAKREK